MLDIIQTQFMYGLTLGCGAWLLVYALNRSWLAFKTFTSIGR